MQKKNDIQNSEYQLYLEKSVLDYQKSLESDNKTDIDLAYQKVVKLYNPLDFYSNWYEQYKYLFDSEDDFVADYLRVFATVLKNWKPRNLRAKSRYEGSGEFKNYFIGSLYHNYINMVKSDQAAKRNLTKQCPICFEWVNPISTHLITFHADILWNYLEELDIDLDSLTNCPLCTNFKITKSVLSSREKTTQILKAHFISKHTSMLFNKFNELYPDISTISPKITSTYIEEDSDELDIYDVTETKDCLVSKLLLSDLDPIQKTIVENILNGESNLIYKADRYRCTKEEWENALQSLKETINIYGWE